MKFIIKILVYSSFLIFILSCKSELTKTNSTKDNVETDESINKPTDDNKNRKIKKTSQRNKAGQKNEEYWTLLRKRVHLDNDQIDGLRKLQVEYNSAVKSKDPAAIKNLTNQQIKLIGESKLKKKEIFDRNWRNPLSSLSLFSSLNIERKKRKPINELTKKYNGLYFNQSKELKTAQKKELKSKLIAQKLVELKKVLGADKFSQLETLMDQSDKRKIRGIYPFN